MTHIAYYLIATLLFIFGLAIVWVIARTFNQIEHRITVLEEQIRQIEEVKAQGAAFPYNLRRGLEDALALVIDMKIQDDAERARLDTLQRYLQLLQNNRHNTEKPAREQ
jgi:hypothetical protein